MSEPLRALSVRQPFAHAIVYLAKYIENRKRTHPHRGLTLIHASAGMTRAQYHDAIGFMHMRGVAGPLDLPGPDIIERGGIIGAVDMTGCVDLSPSRWFVGPKGFVLANPRPIPFIACKGTISPLFWIPAPDVQAHCRAALGISD